MPGKCNGDNIISSKDSRGSSSKGQQGAVCPLCEMLEAICHAAAGKRRAAKREKAAARELEREKEKEVGREREHSQMAQKSHARKLHPLDGTSLRHRHFNYEKGKYFVKTTQQDIN